MTAKYEKIIEDFTVDSEELEEIAAIFRRDIVRGLAGDENSAFKMLKSYLGLPTRQEKGEFIALDFGGTNVRALLIRLLGGGKSEIVKKASGQLVNDDHNYISADNTADDLFGFIADIIMQVAEPDKEYRLGHTFSFPSYQENLSDARLISWTKEFATKGVEGENVSELLAKALAKRGGAKIKPVAVLNDTVAVVAAAAYKYDNADIGSICGTGHNTAYLERYKDSGKAIKPMILNLECGNFDKLVTNHFDQRLDSQSEKPGEQRLEKMVSGCYLGELFYLAVCEAFDLEHRNVYFDGADLSAIIGDRSGDLAKVRAVLKEKIGFTLDEDAAVWVRAFAEAIVVRSARLVAATYVGIIWHMDGDAEGAIGKHIVAIDGSLFEKMPLYAENMRKAVSELLGSDAAKIELVLENGGSGLGAAIAAAVE
jgi:hexokinase